MPNVRPAAVANLFYPGDSAALATTLQRLLAQAGEPPAPAPKALIVPHAGYVYSGSTAARAYASIAALRSTIRRVVLLGPVHRVAGRGLALPSARAFATPLGTVATDGEAAAGLSALPQVVTSDAAHALEHSIEVQLPFLQTVLDDFRLVALAVGSASAAEVAQAIEAVWGGPETLLVVSSDLSHFLDYEAASARDRRSVARILALEGALTPHDACGSVAINGLLLAARRRALAPRLLQLCNSGDTAGERQRVVGYAAVSLHEGAADVH